MPRLNLAAVVRLHGEELPAIPGAERAPSVAVAEEAGH